MSIVTAPGLPTSPVDLVVHPNNRIGRLDGFFHFVIGYLAPTLYALRDAEVTGAIGVEATGPFDRFWDEVRQHRIEVLDPHDPTVRSAGVHLRPRGFDAPTGHARTPWMPVRRSVLNAFDIDTEDEPAGDASRPRILIIDRAQVAAEPGAQARGRARRSVPNLPDIIERLGAVGDVEVRTFEDLTLREQILATRNADIIVAQHGAVMANLLWARRRTHVIEIVTPEKEKIFTSYFEGLGVPVTQIPQDDVHDPVDVDLIVQAATHHPGDVEPRNRTRSRSEKQQIRWSARAWKRHENKAIDERDTARMIDALDRWSAPDLDVRDEPIFILSSIWRSGSTLLQRLLMSDPKLLIWGEPFGQRDPVRQMTDMYLPFTDTYPTAGHFISERATHDTFSLTESWVANLYPSVEDLQRSHRAFLDTLLAHPAREQGFTRWGLKEVRLDAHHGAYLQHLYPGARLIFLIRNPYAAFASYIARAGWYERFPDRPVFDALAFAQQWRRVTQTYLDEGPRLGAFTMRFEDMVAQPDLLTSLGNFTATSIDASVLTVKRRGRDEVEPARMHAKERRIFEQELGELAASLGYGPID
jgi:hypothetical protein